MIAAASNAAANVAGGVAAGLAVAAFIVLYFLPVIVAWRRRIPNVSAVVIIDLFLGWTFVGWVIALVLACQEAPRYPPR